ncbi:MAG: GTPase ObgE, partial [Cytophagia bacterium]|nr:GTPase ObgE [Cytophagia bacterium]
MAAPNFIDYVKFCSRSGAGGAGYLHFNREKHLQHGGPDGGD